MTDTSPEGALQHPASGLHPADPVDDPHADDDGAPAADAGPPDLLDDAAALAVDSPDPGDAVPGDGTVGERPAAGDADALQLSAYGREAEAARELVADDTPAPRETPGEGV